MTFPSTGHHRSPVTVLLWSRMIRDGGGWQGVRVLRRGHLFGRLAFLWLRALPWAALLWDERLASPQASSPLESSYCGRPAACSH